MQLQSGTPVLNLYIIPADLALPQRKHPYPCRIFPSVGKHIAYVCFTTLITLSQRVAECYFRNHFTIHRTLTINQNVSVLRCSASTSNASFLPFIDWNRLPAAVVIITNSADFRMAITNLLKCVSQ